MDNKIKFYLFIIIFNVSTIACDKVDIRNMFINYEPVDERFDHSMAWNENHPFKEISLATDNYTLFTMGDSHIGGTKNFDAFIDSSITSNAAAAVLVGDITNGNESDYDMLYQHLPNPAPLAIFPIVGNHDLYFNGWEKFWTLFGTSTFLFTVKTPVASDLYICLDTGGGTLGSKQLVWFKEVLANQRPNYRRCIILTHNNLFRFRRTSSTNPLAEELYVLLDLFAIHQVDMVITGHDHAKDAEVFGNTTHIVMDALKDEYKEAGYFKLNVQGGIIQYQFINF